MRSIEEILEEKHRIALRTTLDSGIPLQKAEAIYLADKFKEIMLEALIEMTTALPRVPNYENRIHCFDNKSVAGRHLVDGQWRRIAQLFSEDGSVIYYTDAKREHDKRGSN